MQKMAWLLKQPDLPERKGDVDSLWSDYTSICMQLMDMVERSYCWGDMDADGKYHRFTSDLYDGTTEVWELIEVPLQTSIAVTFYEKEEDTYYHLNMLISADWIDIDADRTHKEREVTHGIFAREDFIAWVQTDPMFQRGDLWGMLQYAVEVHGMPAWIYKVRPLQ